MASINRVTLIGNLGRDPERMTTSGGQAFARFSLATNENYQDRSGQWQTSTEWHTVKVWGPSADRVMQQLRKGSSVYIEGSLRSYEVGESNPNMGPRGGRTRLWEVKALTWRRLGPAPATSTTAAATPSAQGEAPCPWDEEIVL